MSKRTFSNNVWKCAILAVDKCKNITSAKTVEKVKNVLNDNCSNSRLKVGHGGTLDENATGVLVIGSGYGCKLLENFLHGSKEYLVTGCFGIETDTYNECGKVVDKLPYDHISYDHIKAELKKFTGRILQKPPAYSALKFGGKRASDLTRCGIHVEMIPRAVKCYDVVLTSFDPPYFNLRVTCGGGFYVRSLIHDLGRALGSCAHVTELRRTMHGFLSENEALPIGEASYSSLLANTQQIAKVPEFRSLLHQNKAMTSKSKMQRALWTDTTEITH